MPLCGMTTASPDSGWILSRKSTQQSREHWRVLNLSCVFAAVLRFVVFSLDAFLTEFSSSFALMH